MCIRLGLHRYPRAVCRVNWKDADRMLSNYWIAITLNRFN
jgi:hypothetical protein